MSQQPELHSHIPINTSIIIVVCHQGFISAKDKFHDVVKIALEKDGWQITDDPLSISVGGVDMLIDLGAERLIAAERQGEKIAVEIKSFLNTSAITDFHLAVGQFINYRTALKFKDPQRQLFLAIPLTAYNDFFKREFAIAVVEDYQFKLLVYRCRKRGDSFMEKVEKYRDCIKQILTKYAAYKPSYGEVEMQVIFDTEHNHYQVVRVGWDNKQRVYGCPIHLDIKDGKIWIQQNETEIDLGQELVNIGVPKSDIVVGFHPPYMRQFTEFAVS